MKSYNFTKEEIEVVESYLFKKICRLEDADLKDSYCYPRLVSFRQKLLGRTTNENNKSNAKISRKL